ncbi:MAG: ShlB/FhaC/HecB family hemolysin secretion/activation protein [Xenococcaceae cyanobacterium]
MQLKSGFKSGIILAVGNNFNLLNLQIQKSKLSAECLKIESILSVILTSIIGWADCSLAQTIVSAEDSTFLTENTDSSNQVANSFLTISLPDTEFLITESKKAPKNLPSSRFTVSDRPIEVKTIEVSGNSMFETEITQLTQKLTGKSATLAELYQLRSSISKLYVDNGYVNSGAYLPPQKLQDGVVKIEVLEGGIETIEITGNKRLSTRYIASRLKSLPTPINTEQLLERLQLLRLDPLIENVSAELSAGLTPGMSRLDIEVQEANAFTFSSSLNNHKSPSIGSNSRNLNLSHSNLLGFGDKAQLNYTNTEGSNGLDIAYALPINAQNGTISFAYGFNSNELVENPFTPLDIETESNYYEFSFRQPIVYKSNRELALGLSFSRQHSETSLLDIPFPLSLGADESGNTNISALRFFQEYTERSDNSFLALRSQFSFGLDIFDATINENAPDSTFFAWRGQSQWVRKLDDDFLFLLRGELQISDNLVPLEQFRLGGATSVRGYRQDLSLSESGMFASAELRVPILRINKLDGVLQLVPFFDLGLPWYGEDAIIDIDSLISVGMGLNFNAGDRFNARLDYGIPLTDTQVNRDSLQEDGVTFSLGYSF